MYLLLCLVIIIGSVTGVPLKSGNATRNENDDLRAQYVLPGESMPTFYDVRLSFPENNLIFVGEVTIRVLPVIETQVLVLHAMAMTIGTVEVFAERDTENENDLVDHFELAEDDTHFLTIHLTTPISPTVPHFIHILYVGTFATNMFGVYRSSYLETSETRNLITSQLQPTFARRAFPCYDEPHLKAVFRTTIYAPPTYTVVRSNMPQREPADEIQEPIEGLNKFEFQDTLIMSTYLNAYLVSNFDYISNDVADPNVIYPIPFKIFSRPSTQATAEYALQFGQENMQALQDYTEFQYYFPKIDKVAVPDFAAGAMENWGLVIYREVALLVQDGVTTTAIRQNVARIICHENVHMWFGNEVSPQSWTYTWLNEGFANFFENFGTDLVRPGYRMMDQFVLLLQGVMQNDAVLNVNPMTHPVYTPSQILSTFNAVAYQKSGSVIRMMQHFLTPEIFRRGLIIYIQDNHREATNPTHLYAALQQALDESDHSIPWPLATIMDRWTNQGGFPVLNVRRTAPGANSLFVDQERFLTDATLRSPDRWHVPINWVLSTDIDFSDTSPQAWVAPTFPALHINIPGLTEAEWFIANKKQTGYYRVNYDPENWAALARVLNTTLETIDLLNRAQIIDDSFNLARNGRLSYLHPLEISHYLVQEKDYIPWASFHTALNYLDIVLSGTEVYDLFQEYMLYLTAPLFEELGFDVAAGEEHVTPYLRNIILDVNCRYGNELCVERAEELLEHFISNTNEPPNADIQTTVFCSALRGGSERLFTWLWGRYHLSDSSQQSILLNALGCTSDPTLRDNYLNMVISDSSEVREQDRHTIIVSVINSSPENMEAALDFVIEHFHEIQPRVQGLTGTTNILNAFARRLNSEDHDSKINDFVTQHQTIFTAGELAAVGAIRDNIASSITWNNVNLGTVSAWLRDNYGNGANALSSSLVIVLSAIFAMYMY